MLLLLYAGKCDSGAPVTLVSVAVAAVFPDDIADGTIGVPPLLLLLLLLLPPLPVI